MKIRSLSSRKNIIDSIICEIKIDGPDELCKKAEIFLDSLND
jgi:hypothetical protein